MASAWQAHGKRHTLSTVTRQVVHPAGPLRSGTLVNALLHHVGTAAFAASKGGGGSDGDGGGGGGGGPGLVEVAGGGGAGCGDGNGRGPPALPSASLSVRARPGAVTRPPRPPL